MFLRTEIGTFVNVDSIQAIEVVKFRANNGNNYVLKLWLPDDESYTGAIYNNKEDAEYALNFLFSLINNTRNENRICYKIPTQDDVETYKWADKIDKDMETSEETEQEK